MRLFYRRVRQSPCLPALHISVQRVEMTLVSGTHFGSYEVLRPLGAGGMGEVYLARDQRLERNVAIKVLPEEFTADSVSVRRFEREAKAASALNHPNIVTIYEIGESSGFHYISTEYIEGETLREGIVQHRLSVPDALDIAIQIASALSAAHHAGIIHRDIKPENVMVRPDGYAKVLDFGLVKLTEKEYVDVQSRTRTLQNTTEPGHVVGTVRYMSPEQARGKPLDGRTDIFSLGIILYEMVTGCAPFDGDSIADILAAILKNEPQPLAGHLPNAPEELQRVVGTALLKDRNERYQTMNELLLDLKNLRDELQVQSKLERSPDIGSTSNLVSKKPAAFTSGETQNVTAQTSTTLAPRTISSAEYIFHQVQTHKAFTITTLLLIVIAAGAFFYINRRPVLTEQDTILVADFLNSTGDSIFDGTLKQGLAVQLSQSPFLHLFADIRVRQTLRLMGRSPEERVTAEIGREICERQGLKALIVGAIAPLGSHYVISLEAVNGKTGEELAREQAEAESKEEVLKTLSRAASRLREKLGESLGSIQKFDAPLEATTSSLEALKAFSLGVEQTQVGKFLEAIPYYKRAIELDPQFGYAYGSLAVNYYNTRQPSLAAEYAEKAFALRERMSELEKLRISSFYYAFVTGEVDKGIETVELYKRTYPRDERGPLNLSDRYQTMGQFEKAVTEARQALALNPNNAVGYWNLANSLTGLSRFSEAKEICEQAITQKLDTIALHSFLYQISFAQGDAAAMQEQVTWASGRPDAYMALDWQNSSLAFEGQWRKAQEYSQRAIDLAVRSNAKEVGARYAAEAGLRSAAFGQCAQTDVAAERASGLEHNRVSLPRVALALAMCGEASQTQLVVDELVRRYPKDTLINHLWIPVIKAALELQRHNPGDAVQVLDEARRYEAIAEFWARYLRGLSYLAMKSGKEAAAEFQGILDHRGEAVLSVLYPLARLGLARANAIIGDVDNSRKEYQEFFSIWKDADADLPILIEAKKELSSLRPHVP